VPRQLFSSHQAPQKFRRRYPDSPYIVRSEDLNKFYGRPPDRLSTVGSYGRIVVDF
jgi:hypothetical protein